MSLIRIINYKRLLNNKFYFQKDSYKKSLILLYSYNLQTPFVTYLPGNVFSNTNLSPNSNGKAAGKGLVLTWNPKKQMDK